MTSSTPPTEFNRVLDALESIRAKTGSVSPLCLWWDSGESA